MNFQNKFLIFGIIIFLVVLGYLVFAWSEPSQPPPQGNVYAPLNTGPHTQTKSGGLIIQGNISSPGNQKENCTWTSWTCDSAQTCPAGKFVAGVERYTTGTLCGTAPTQWYQMRLYCCDL